MKILAFNWKLNPVTEREALSLLSLSDRKGVVLFPPAVFLNAVARRVKKADVGAQNLFWETEGAFTGETSPAMVKSLGVRWSLVGHSERRKYFGETDEVVNKKMKAALAAGLNVVLCVGEPSSARKRGIHAARTFIRKQLVDGLSGVENFKLQIKNLVVAYEPVWAISEGVARHPSDTPQDSAETARFIKEILTTHRMLDTKVLYGGSVDSKNVADFLKPREIDGVLIGGASVKKEELKKILKISNIK